jgi:hypothetical protein
MKQLKILIHTYIGRFYNLFKLTPKKTIMWIEVPMSCNSVEHKNDIMISTINHMEQTIKIIKK